MCAKLGIRSTILPPRPYRDAALSHLQVLLAIGAYMSAGDARLAWTAVSTVFRLTSVRDLSESEIATQLGASLAEVRRATTEFKRLANLRRIGSGD